MPVETVGQVLHSDMSALAMEKLTEKTKASTYAHDKITCFSWAGQVSSLPLAQVSRNVHPFVCSPLMSDQRRTTNCRCQTMVLFLLGAQWGTFLGILRGLDQFVAFGSYYLILFIHSITMVGSKNVLPFLISQLLRRLKASKGARE